MAERSEAMTRGQAWVDVERRSRVTMEGSSLFSFTRKALMAG